MTDSDGRDKNIVTVRLIFPRPMHERLPFPSLYLILAPFTFSASTISLTDRCFMRLLPVSMLRTMIFS